MTNSQTLHNSSVARARAPAVAWLSLAASQLRRWLDGDPLAFSDEPLTAAQLRRVRSAQLALTQSGGIAPAAAGVLVAALLPIAMWSTSARAPLLLWALTVAVNMALTRAVAGGSQAYAIQDAREVRRATLRSIVTATIWAFGLALAQHAADADQRMLVATLAMSVMSGGALQLVVSPPQAFGFIAPLALGCAFAAWRSPHAIAAPVFAAQCVNAAFLLFQSHVQAGQLARRAVSRLADEVASRLDPLTGLNNRLGLSEHLDGVFARLAVSGETFALVCFDLDGFQFVNDSFGHRAGDAMIARAASALRAASGKGDCVARLGGDEFALVADAADREAAAALAERVAAEFARPFAFEWGESACSVTMGVALAPVHGADGDHLARAAESALYRAKQHGRGSIVFVDDAESREARERRAIEVALRRALRNGEMRLDFQPLVDAVSGATNGFEALLRWRRPGQPEAPASLFIRAAEECGCLEEIGVWALREATRVAATWPRRLRVAVNVSAAQLKSPLLAAAVRDIVEVGGFDSRRLELEVSESSLIEDFAAAAANLNALRRYGVSIALDDFGAGFSSMSSIARLPLDRIKIDRTLVVGALGNPRCAAVIRSAARLAKELGLALTGEGVETREQFDLLRSAGCDEAQGFYFSRPVPADALAAMYAGFPDAPLPRPPGECCEDCKLPWCVEAGMCRHKAM